MDKTELTNKVAELFRISGHKVDVSVKINHREIDIRAEETQGLVRKIILIECADHEKTVGVDKMQTDINKLEAAQAHLRGRAVVMHVSKNGYSPEASGYALDQGIDIYTLEDLEKRLVNFENYIEAVKNDKIRNTILKEYQPNNIHFEKTFKSSQGAIKFLESWLKSENNWLTLLGDYGVGKSWTLKRFLYFQMEKYTTDPNRELMPFFIPLQKFTKAFDFKNLILGTFQIYGLSGVHFSAFEYLMNNGKILFLLDSFDEMAQHLNKNTIRENLREILMCISHKSKAIMTSRPNYFEGRAERLLVVEKNGLLEWHPLDEKNFEHQTSIARSIKSRFNKSQFARINDLTIEQRKNLFRLVLGSNKEAYNKLMELFDRFQELENISQRAVIARLLTTVAETLASKGESTTIDGFKIIPDDLSFLNQAKIFEIIILNLLSRDENIGSLSSSQRYLFLKRFSLFLQQPKRDFFATPDEIKNLVRSTFDDDLRRTDSPEQQLENYYRTCRRHSGLTTEGQFFDTSGNLDFPVDEQDTDSRVGFSHNSIREFLVAESIVDYLVKDIHHPNLDSINYTDVIGDFIVFKSDYDPVVRSCLSEKYATSKDGQLKELLFKIIFRFIQNSPEENIFLLGSPPKIPHIDISLLDLSGLNLRSTDFIGSLISETDFRKSDLRHANFANSIIEKAMFDEADVKEADFTEAELVSIYVFDEFATNTSSVLTGKSCRQWLHTKGAKVFPIDDLNPLLGKPWYEAAREVTRTLEAQIAGTHQDVALTKGTKLNHRPFAKDFVKYLIKKEILLKITKSKTGPGWVLKVNPAYRTLIEKFGKGGIIDPLLKDFFVKRLKKGEKLDI
jgi:hypothetical protein